MTEPLHISQGITDLPEPTTDPDAATKKYVDDNIGGGGAVDSVFGRTGIVAAATSDYDADQIDFTPAGTISATDVQAAIEEVAAEATGAVSSVFTRTGAVVASAGDYTASEVTNVAAGGISAVTVQAALDELDTEKQPVDSDLTAIAGLDSSTSGAIASDGAGWIKKTYAQFKTALSLVKGDVGLGNVDNTADASKNVATAAALTTARNIDGQAFDGTGNITVIAPGTHAATGKTTPVDADELPLVDSAASNVLKKLTWANLKATLKTYFDTLYTAAGASAPPNGSAGGDLTGTYPNPTLAAAGGGAAGPTGSATVIPIVTVDAKGRVTALSSATAAPTNAAGGDLAGNYPNPTIGTGKVTSAMILDGTIVAADLANSARYRDWRVLSVVSGAIMESIPRSMAVNNGAVLATGRLNVVAIPVLANDVLTSVSFNQATTAFTGASHAWFALIDSSLNVIRQSTDQLAAGITANTTATLAMDSVPVTAGARVASSTVTLTFPTLSQALSAIFAVGDSIVVSNANIAAYNGTFTIVTVTSTQITYVSGGSATDSLAAPFPTVQMAAGKRTYTVAADGYVYAGIMLAGTVGTHVCAAAQLTTANTGKSPIDTATSSSSLTGTCTSPIGALSSSSLIPWAALS